MVAVLALLAGTCPAQAQTGVLQARAAREQLELRQAFHPVVADAARGTVGVLCDGRPAVLGTVVGAEGWVLTKASELHGATAITCRLPGGREVPARLVGVAAKYDLAMLKVDGGGLTPVTWAQDPAGQGPAVGQWVATVGPQAEAIAVGVVSVERRGIPPQSAMLGIMMGEALGGVRVLQVFPDSPAAKAGLAVDDVVLSIADKPTPHREALVAQVQSRPPGTQVPLLVRRGREKLTLQATLGSRGAVLDTRLAAMNHLGGELSDRSTGFPAVIQHDTVLAPEDCGGPLVDLHGAVLGINIARAGRTESYTIPADVVTQLIEPLESGNLAPATDKLR
jgi:serine protease Do